MITPILLAVLAWPGPTIDYAKEVKPILAERCAGCHGAIRQKAGLRLDTAALMVRGGESGPAIQPGRSGKSLLIERLTTAETSERMPPDSDGTPLSPAEIATLRTWIDQGAKAPPEPTPPDPRRHWAFQPPMRPSIPRVSNPAWSLNPIDAFLDAAHRSRGLKPAPPVGKDLWLRRVSLDLIGLTPSRQELHAFQDDHTPNAAEKVVDRLLASPRYGERWGRHWMDIWRYSDWYGLGAEVRYSHPHIWRWRDWIVASLNADKGYDRMVMEMLAGDEIAPDDPDTVRATGFLARNWDIFNRNVWLASTVEHTSRAFLGLTVQCARCHDHKFDPISQADYYRLRAFFEPYHIRVDRVPHEPDRAKAGLTRAFDDFLDRPTFLFVRGEESRPDTAHPLKPATPSVLGGEVRIGPIQLPLTASCPDKRPFVIDEAMANADRTVEQARIALEKASGAFQKTEATLIAARDSDSKAGIDFTIATAKPDLLPSARSAAASAVEALSRARQAAELAREEKEVAESALALAEAKRSALRAVLAIERLEDDGAKTSGSASWVEAARTTFVLQRAVGLANANFNLIQARRDTARAQRTHDGLLLAATIRDDPTLKETRAKAATSLVEAKARLSKAEKQRSEADSLAKKPPTTDYAPRTLEFPRAKTTYRDTPSTAPYSKTSTGRRLALARWIVGRRNPLAARVAVNHIWARHFGEPLVGGMSDFGLRSPRPELIDLLDWLAVELMDSGWSQKHLHRLIVTSRAYRMRSSETSRDDPNLRIDRDNHYVWRMNPGRMEGEVIRDTVLFLAGRLDSTIGGPDLPIESADTGRRRTFYYRVARDERVSLLTAFDAPNVEDCYRRHETIVPQQALAMINSGMVLTGAGQIAMAIEKAHGADHSRSAFVAAAFENILGRTPSDAEQTACQTALAKLAKTLSLEKPGADPESPARSALVHVLLNHNDFITIR